MSGTNGSVAIARPDNEYDVLCDDVGYFLRRYTTEGGAPVTTDTELDGATPYVPTGRDSQRVRGRPDPRHRRRHRRGAPGRDFPHLVRRPGR